MNQLPEIVEFEAELFENTVYAPTLYGKVLTIFRDSEGEQWVAFECHDMPGVHLISLASRFFKGLRTSEARK
jgi:hypothetical protein